MADRINDPAVQVRPTSGNPTLRGPARPALRVPACVIAAAGDHDLVERRLSLPLRIRRMTDGGARPVSFDAPIGRRLKMMDGRA